MTLNQTIKKINGLQHLIGKNVPKWNSPVLEIIPAPVSNKFPVYIKTYKQTNNVDVALSKVKATQYDILFIFSKGKEPFAFVYEWYGFFYNDMKKEVKRDTKIIAAQSPKPNVTLQQVYEQLLKDFIYAQSNAKQLPAA